LGLVVLGTRVAQALQVFEFPVVGYSRTPKALPGVTSFHGEEGLAPFLARSRVLVNLLPLTDATRGILNRATLGQLPAGAYLI
ncbi:NAD(P)-dependent oxidoreductase, partial [Gulbenkiania mobilis]|uniref:NAD(P)-dependent oxidoreductase n=1 Tax=Gulbenkiania mobilis TaxID=397457 RepID=UPI000A655ECB